MDTTKTPAMERRLALNLLALARPLLDDATEILNTPQPDLARARHLVAAARAILDTAATILDAPLPATTAG